MVVRHRTTMGKKIVACHGAPPLNLRVAATHMAFTASTTPGPGNHCSLATNCQKLTTCRPLVTSEKKTLFIWSCRCKGLEKKTHTRKCLRAWCSVQIRIFTTLTDFLDVSNTLAMPNWLNATFPCKLIILKNKLAVLGTVASLVFER